MKKARFFYNSLWYLLWTMVYIIAMMWVFDGVPSLMPSDKIAIIIGFMMYSMIVGALFEAFGLRAEVVNTLLDVYDD